MSEITPYEKRMEGLNDAFNSWWDDWDEDLEDRKFYEGVSREVAEAIFKAGFRLGGYTPWTSMNPTQLAMFAKLFAEKKQND